MAIDAAASERVTPAHKVAPHPVYEGQAYYSFDDVVNSFSFWDLLDIINPLQHIPLVSSIYREITGDEINGFARVAGGALYGGIAGAGFGIVGMALDEATGGDAVQLAFGAVSSMFEDDPVGAADGANLASGSLGSGGAGGSAPGSTLMASLDRDGAHTSVFARVPSAAMMMTAPPPPPTGTLALTGSGALANGPLGGQLLGGLPDGTGQVVSGTTGGGGLGSSADVLTLNGAQSAALAAFVSQNAGSQRTDAPGRSTAATMVAAATVADSAARATVTAPTQTSSDTQSQDMPQTPNREFSGRSSDRETGRNPTTVTIPDDIRRGREAQQARLTEARALAEARATAEDIAAQTGASGATGLSMPGAAPVESASVPTDGRRMGMSLADYRASPNRRGEDATAAAAAATRGTRRTGAGGGAAVGGLLPNAATMAGLLERGETVATVAARQGQRIAEGVSPPIHGAGELDFRALPLGETGETGAAPSSGGAEPNSGEAPIAMQPWFSDRVMDAMRRYDASRGAAAS